MSLDLRLKRADRIYRAGEMVNGLILVSSKGGLSHNGITLSMEGVVTLQLSAKSVGMFEAFYNSIKPIQLIQTVVEIAKPGKLPDGDSEIPFELPLQALPGQQLYETYHGVFVNVQYQLRCTMPRPLLAKNLEKSLEFIVEVPQSPKDEFRPQPVPFTLSPEVLDNVKRPKNLPKFRIGGKLTGALCSIGVPFTGELTVEECDTAIKSVELQLVRVETCGCAEGFAKESTEIQNIQVAEGDIMRGFPIALYMIFPRLFTCPTIATRTFKIEFEINLVVLFYDGYLVTENFPIKLVRRPPGS